MEEKEFAPRPTSGLVRHLTAFDVMLMVVATPAASGIIYYSVSKAGAFPGGCVWLAFLIGTLLFLPICFVVAVASAAAPRPGSMYVFVSRTVNPRVAFVAGAMLFFGYSLTIGVLGGIVTRLLATLFQTVGLSGSHKYMSTLARALSSDHAVLVGGLIWVLLFWLLSSFGLRHFRPVLRAIYIIPIVATGIAILIFLSTSPSEFSSAFESTWGEGIVAKILELGRNKGFSPGGFSWPNTFALLLVVLWAFGGVEMAAYVSGEVRSARRSMFVGYILGWAILGTLYVAFSAVTYKALGPEFPGVYAYLHDNHLAELQEIMGLVPPAPSVPFYLISVLGGTTLAIVLAVCLILWFVNTMPGFFLGISRLLFGFGQDGQLPGVFKKYSSRWRTPTVATHATALTAVFGCVIYAYHASAVLSTIDFLIYFFVWLYGLGAILYACREQESLDVPVVRLKVFGIPVLGLAGLVVFLEGWLFIFLTLNGLSWATRGWLLLIMLTIAVVIIFQSLRTSRTGIDESAIYVKLPPDADED